MKMYIYIAIEDYFKYCSVTKMLKDLDLSI